MPRNMSFMLTTDQIRNQTKTVTRRLGWSFLEVGDIVNACVKCMGLKKGEKIEKICQVRITNTRIERLGDLGSCPRNQYEETFKEGFPGMTGWDFIKMFCKEMNCTPETKVNRIEFEYVEKKHKIITGDCLEELKEMEADSVDLVFCSPPYEDARTYGMGYKIKDQEWVDWCIPRYLECLRVSKGLVAWVVEGRTRKFRYSATPILLAAELHKQGVHLRKPPVFHKVGIPGSGGPDWLRNDWEFIVCATSGGKLPWSDNTAMGNPCKFPVGGRMSNRNADGLRKNASAGPKTKKRWAKTPSETRRRSGASGNGSYKPPKIANPGNVIHCKVGGGHLGSEMAHENEAPFPEQLAEFFVRSFCPPGGTVLDPFSGSGTTAKVAGVHGRRSISIDIRESQSELTNRRLQEV